MSKTLPVLIGSRALVEYDINIKFRDIDLIVDTKFKNEFPELNIDWYLIKDKSDQLIFDKCNNELTCKKILFPFGEVLLPPLEILYIITKSHIHRILPITSYQDQNIEIWFKHVNTYNKIRNKLDYKKLDNTLYDDLGNWKQINKDEFILELYQTRFREIIDRVGDTMIKLEGSGKDFFEDNVERFIDHDELHKKVALMCRKDPNPIFKKYQENDEEIKLSRELFLKADYNERIQMIREEIIVLFLERHWIPEIIKCYKNQNKPYFKYNRVHKIKEFMQVCSNFITNLCGQDDHWLRRFCLDHIKILTDVSLYNFDELESLVLNLVDYKKLENKYEDIDFFKIVNEYKNQNLNFFEKIVNIIKNPNNKCFTCENKIQKDYVENSSQKFKIHYVKYFDMEKSIEHGCKLLHEIYFGDSINKHLYDILILYFKNICNIGMIDRDDIIIYNIWKNIGFRYNKLNKKINIFNLTLESENSGQLSIEGMYIKINSNDISSNTYFSGKEYSKNCRTYYYHSRYCSWESECEQSYYFMTSYGRSPKFISNFLQLLAKYYLNVEYTSDYVRVPLSYDENYCDDSGIECENNRAGGYYVDRSDDY